jgi:transcription elongation factor Elf1/ribosomal protein L20A (L18A)
MINFKFDDKKDIESKISNNYVNQENPEETIRDLARYNHHILGMKKEDNYDAILSYMIKNCNDFYEEKYFKIIYRNIASAKKYKFRSVSPVIITKSEIEKILKLNDIRKEKIAFVLLAVAKYYNNVSSDNNNRMYISMSDLFKLARVAITCKERATYMHFAYQEGLLVEHMFVGTNLKVVGFIDDNSETVLELGEDDYKELAYVYLNYKNGGYKHCKGCGKLFKMHKNSPGRLYCKECGQKKEPSEFKVIKCADCGEDVVDAALNTKTCRCEECQDKANKERYSRYNSKRRS